MISNFKGLICDFIWFSGGKKAIKRSLECTRLSLLIINNTNLMNNYISQGIMNEIVILKGLNVSQYSIVSASSYSLICQKYKYMYMPHEFIE